jgi:hypothetical protein
MDGLGAGGGASRPMRMVLAAPAAPPPPAPPRDPREDADWFQRLPAMVQAEFRAKWQQEAVEQGKYMERMRRYGWRSLAEGAVLMVSMQLITWPTPRGLLAAVVVGAAMGWTWHRLKAGRTRCMLLGMLAWTVQMALAGGFLKMLPASILLFACCVALGILRESWYRNDAIGW